MTKKKLLGMLCIGTVLVLTSCSSLLGYGYVNTPTRSSAYAPRIEETNDIHGKITRSTIRIVNDDKSQYVGAGNYTTAQYFTNHHSVDFIKVEQSGKATFYLYYQGVTDWQETVGDLFLKLDGEIITLKNPKGSSVGTLTNTNTASGVSLKFYSITIWYTLPENVLNRLMVCQNFSLQYLKDEKFVPNQALVQVQNLIGGI